MAFIATAISGSTLLTAAGIGAAGAVAGGAISASGAKSAAKTASKGSKADLQFQREGRDLARGDAAPYRQAGATALDALMSMTGLGVTNFGGTEAGRKAEDERVTGGEYLDIFRGQLGNKGRKKLDQYQATNPYQSGYNDQDYIQGAYDVLGGRGDKRLNRFQERNPFVGAALGAHIGPSQAYNVNEMGPENVYRGGSYSRNSNPATIDGATGYVQPNIQGRAYGGFIGSGQRDIMQNAVSGGMAPPMSSPPQMPGQQGTEQPGAGRSFDSTAINPATGYPNENPGGMEGGYNFQTDPGYQFRFSEGMRAMDRSAAARGGLLSGGYGRALTRYGQDYASNEYNNVYNRIAGIAGIGQTASGQSGQYAMYGGQGMGNAASNAANASAYGQIGAGNAWANAGNQIAQLPWGNVFNGGGQISEIPASDYMTRRVPGG